MPDTLFGKIWNEHLVADLPGGGFVLYVDRHLVHEVTSPQAFDGLRHTGRKVRRPDLTFATVDHNVPTDGRPIDPETVSGMQLAALAKNCREFGVELFGYLEESQGIVHVIGPQLGITVPGVTVVCGDSHTSTHGAFGALAIGIGTSEVEHVLATQTLRWSSRPKTLGVQIDGKLGQGVEPKDVMLALIRKLGAGGGTGFVAEYFGSTIERAGMSGRMTICNMSIEMGARAGLVAPDQATLDYVTAEDRPFAPKGAALNALIDRCTKLHTDSPACFDRLETMNVDLLKPQVTWGTTPAMTVDIDESIPEPQDAGESRALSYMGLKPGMTMQELAVNTVFIGSCTNARIEDLRSAAGLVKGRHVAPGVRAMVVPGSEHVRQVAEREGLRELFVNAGFEWHRAGCSMCLGMNGDLLRPMERSASTSNRPYEGRQGPGSRTHLVSPLTAAASAIEGRFADPRGYLR